jgi:ATP-dependent DNA helicase DinG
MTEILPLRLAPEASARIRTEVERAGGREVCFLATVTEERIIVAPRAVARGNRMAVLAAAHDANPGEILIHNHPSGVLEPSDADLEVAARVFEEGLGTAITDNLGEGLYVVVEPPRPRVRAELSLEAVEGYLAPQGGLAGAHRGYEDRPGQRAMARAIAARYNEGGVLLAEAGTGTGKSLAYLVPAALWALRNGERTVISTNTINLQEQLVGKDLPLLEGVLGEKVSWALVKGRGNYISIRRLLVAMETAPTLFENPAGGELEALKSWIERTPDGSLSDLPTLPSDEVWEEVRSDGDICLKARCPHFQSCFYQRARRQAAAADLLVVNHALLFSDLSLRRASENWSMAAVLPPFRHVILDEAHNVEDAATLHLGVDLSRAGLYRIFSRLDRNGKGILADLEGRLEGEPSPEGAEDRAWIRAQLRPVLTRGREALGRFFDVLEPLVPADEEEAIRLGRGDPRDPGEQVSVLEALDGLTQSLTDLRRKVEALRLRLEEDPARAGRYEDRLLDLRAVERRLESGASGLSLVLDPQDGGGRFVRWVEGTGHRGDHLRNVRLAAAPVEPGELLRESLFDKVDTAILVSATLTTGRDGFRFVRSRLGVDPPRREGRIPDLEAALLLDAFPEMNAPEEEAPAPEVYETLVASPFDYTEQALLAIPTDLPDREAWRPFQESTARVVLDFAQLTEGGLFVLFTSHRAVRETASILRGLGAEARYPLFVHGERSRARILQAFRESGRGILLGTASFWEGVDVPGHALRGLVIQKIPFRVPTEPITQARTEAIEGRGGNGFSGYQVPLAALRLKQGFGRLIRTRTDRGGVVLLDSRILRAGYGRTLLEALPNAPRHTGSWSELRGVLARFYQKSADAPALPSVPNPLD